jgi:hypothetical protein
LIYFVIQEVIKSKPDAANDDKKVNHDNLDGNDDENKEPLCNPPVNAECDSTLCEELDRSEGEPLIDNSIPCVEPRQGHPRGSPFTHMRPHGPSTEVKHPRDVDPSITGQPHQVTGKEPDLMGTYRGRLVTGRTCQRRYRKRYRRNPFRSLLTHRPNPSHARPPAPGGAAPTPRRVAAPHTPPSTP